MATNEEYLSYKIAKKNGEFSEEGNKIMLNKIRTVLRVTLSNGHDSVILGAFGCGAFRLPANEVANQFKSVVMEPEFKNKFKLLVWAIMEKARDGDKYIDFYNHFDRYLIK